MSHINTYQTSIDSLDYLKQACTALNLTFREHQRTAAFYGGQRAKCEHAIRVPNTHYEIGVVAAPNGTYTLLYDKFDPTIERAIGPGGSKLIVEHNLAKALHTVQASGLGVVTNIAKLDNGTVTVTIREC
jgi:hypothetical protein